MNARDTEAMNLFDDSTAHNLESSVETMTPVHDNHTGGPAVLDAPEHAQPSPVEPLASAAPAAPEISLKLSLLSIKLRAESCWGWQR